MNFGETVRACRKLRGVSQTNLALQAEISVSHLCLLEKNKRDPSLSTVSAISSALGIPLGVLMFLAASPEDVTDLSESQIENLSSGILGLIDGIRRQDSLF